MTKTDTQMDAMALEGPILVTGAGGFIGANLLATLQAHRSDAHGTLRSTPNWRADLCDLSNLHVAGGRDETIRILDEIQPRTVFNLAAHGAYSFQSDVRRTIDVNLIDVVDLADWCTRHNCGLVHAGSSSEYGRNSAAPRESSQLRPNSLYAVTKAAAGQWIEHLSRVSALDAVNLRLYSVYGPMEDPSRLFPTLVRQGLIGELPPFSAREVSRDFVFIEDVVEAFLRAALRVRGVARGLSINICSGTKTTMQEIADLACSVFGLSQTPIFGHVQRPWDLEEWYGAPQLAKEVLNWEAATSLLDGFASMIQWYSTSNRRVVLSNDYSQVHLASLGNQHPAGTEYRGTADTEKSDSGPDPEISAIVACYRDAPAIPHMYERLTSVFNALDLSYEIIFVNDASPDDALQVIESLSASDSRIIGITHSRNFGSQSAFLSGMRYSTARNVVLLDGDLQDPPELIADFWRQRQLGFDVVFGRRVDREAPLLMRWAYKAFYRGFQTLSPFHIPRDAGDFCLMSREVADAICCMPERDLFIRAQRAYAGFRQTGVDYVRPERMFGRTTNNLGRNLGWATRGILAVSRAPLTALSLFSLSLFVVSLLLIVAQIGAKFLLPSLAPQGLVSISVLVIGLGSLNLLAVSIVGEYVGRILEEVKRRPRYLRRLITRDGQSRPYSD